MIQTQEEVICAYCERRPAKVQDHVVPRSRGGPDTPDNIVMACVSCNCRKSDRTPSEWLGDKASKNVRAIEANVSGRIELLHRSRRGPKPRWERDGGSGYERPLYESKTDPFDRWLVGAGKCAPSAVVDAAVYVHDTLECAQRIARATFGKSHSPEVVLRIYEAIERRMGGR